MKKIIRLGGLFLYLLCAGATLLSCDDGNDDNGNNNTSGGEDKEVNHWIEQKMREVYLWNTEIPAASKLDFSKGTEDFFVSLLSSKDGKTRNGNHYYYSRVEEMSPTSRIINEKNSYGFEYVGYNMYNGNTALGYIYARVLYVLPDSPAKEAGLKRGDWITMIDGQRITASNYSRLQAGSAVKLTIDDVRVYSLPASRSVVNNPVFLDTVYTVGDKKIAYLVYNSFEYGTDKVYDNRMKSAFASFAAKGANEFVLDLRFNGGGYLTCAQLLAGMLVKQEYKDEIFAYSEDNGGNKNIHKFTDGGTHMNLSKLYVLTSTASASASEVVINGLIPYMGKENIILIGGTTEGKDVGSQEYSSSKYDWHIYPIVVRIFNKSGQNYPNGFTPTYELNEFDGNQELLYPLGDREEPLLATAVSLITGQPVGRGVGVESEKNTGMRYEFLSYSKERYATHGQIILPD